MFKRTLRGVFALSLRACFISLLLVVCLLPLGLSCPVASADTKKEVRIGVLAHRGPEEALRQWQATADYLGAKIPAFTFKIIPLGYQQISSVVRDDRVDFVIANPSIYVELEALYGVTRIATLIKSGNGSGQAQFSGAIFCRSDRNDIHQLSHLKGKSFLAVDENSLGGWQMAWYEFSRQGIDPYKEFKTLGFAGTHDAVVYAVLSNAADAGTARSDTLAQMARDGKVDLSQLRILNSQNIGPYPSLTSTALYPDWPMARSKNVDDALSNAVVIALLSMPPDSKAAHDVGSSGWTTPLDYSPVHVLMRELHLGPYRDYGKVTWIAIWNHYRYAILGGTLFLFVVGGFSVMVAVLYRRLRLTHTATAQLGKKLDLILNSAGEGIFGLDNHGRLTFINEAGATMLGYRSKELIGKSSHELWHHTGKNGLPCPAESCPIYTVCRYGEAQTVTEDIFWRRDGRSFSVEYTCTPLHDGEQVIGAVTVFRDITQRLEIESNLQLTLAESRQLTDELANQHALLQEQNTHLEEAYSELKTAQATILQQEKMASVGQLAAGVAHEINNPMGFIASNLGALGKYLERLQEFIATQEAALGNPEELPKVIEARKKLKIDYVLQDTCDLITESLDGAERVKKIVQNLKSFSRVDQADEQSADLNECLETTLNIVWNELKYKTTVHKEYGELPRLKCYPQQLNQVFMNILVNGAQAIDKQGEITIRTWAEPGAVKVAISDTGSGIPADKLQQIFEPFFTTKPVGSGTGLGLAICYDIVKKHGGEIVVDSVVGSGTTFTVVLPIREAAEAAN